MSFFARLGVAIAALSFPVVLTANELTKPMLDIMHQEKYAHSIWGLYVKDLKTGHDLYDINSGLMFLPASTTKLFSVAALLHTYGDDYRFKTPVYAVGEVQNGRLDGDLVIVGQGDLTMGGRQDGKDTIAFTKMDHIIANHIPGTILTQEDPLYGFKQLAKQVKESGIKEVDGNVLIDDRLFDTAIERGMPISPMMVNENLIDVVINPTSVGQKASLVWRPMVSGYAVANEVKTVVQGGEMSLELSADPSGRKMVVKGTIPKGEQNIVRTFSIMDPNAFARVAFVDALRGEGVKVNLKQGEALPSSEALAKMKPVAVWTSPQLSEYAKLILKVSHNTGANLAPILLAVKEGGRTFDEGMRLLGKFTTDVVKVSPDAFVFIDGAGGDDNRLTLQAEVKLLEYMYRLPEKQFKAYYDALPILGVDGALEDFAKDTYAVGKVRAKTGTGVSYNLALSRFLLTTQALSGYIEGKDDRLLAYMVVVNNAAMPKIEDVFPIFEDEGQISAMIYTEAH